MNSFKNKLGLLSIALTATLVSKAQYPDIPADVKKSSDSLMHAAQLHSDSAWAIAYPIIQKEAKEGKPFIPWASRVDELPQSEVPAFPGAEGGGWRRRWW
jgi:hypothetical protein